MAKRGLDYWRARAVLLEERTSAAAGKLTAEIERQFRLAEKTLDEQIEQWYGRFAKNNDITLAEARQWLTGKDLAEFKWDVNEYIRHGEMLKDHPEFAKQLKNASARVHISRLESLKLKTQATAEALYGATERNLTSEFGKIYEDNYYRSFYNFQQGVNLGWDVAGIDPNRVEGVLSKPWTLDDRTFSDRLWTQKQALVDTLHTQLTQTLMLGASPDKAIAAISKKFGASRANAARLVHTETAYFASSAQGDAWKSLDVEEYVIIEDVDARTCDTCAALNRKHLPMSQFEPGLTAPPFHPYCRGCTAPYLEDDDETELDEVGETVYVPADMSYKQWQEKFVKPALQNSPAGSIIGVTTADGATVKEITDHFIDQMNNRELSVDEVIAALKNPLHVTFTALKNGKPSRRYIGEQITVAYNPDADRVVTGWPTGTRLIKKYGGARINEN
jgi:SPP1 gp7 family putative phage head morphogenesis protein